MTQYSQLLIILVVQIRLLLTTMKLLFSLTLILFSFISFSLSKEEFQFYKNKYKDDNAVILNHNQDVSVKVNKKTGELELFRTDYEEILYLNESSKFYTTRSISLSEYFQDITHVSAVIIKPDGKKIKLKPTDFSMVDSNPSSWVFHDDDREMVFNLKDLGEGYTTIISYTKRLKKPEFFGVMRLMSMYPVESQKISITHNNDVKLHYDEMNLERYKCFKKIETIKELTIDTWEIKNVEAFKREDGSLSSSHYLPQVVARIESYLYEGKHNEIMSSTDDLHSFFEELLLAKGNENDRGELNRIVREITAGKETDLEKMDTIFKWVQSSIKYIAFEDGVNGFVPRSCSKVMKNRYGDCKDMGNLLVEMLTYAKVNNAHVAWVGTRDIPYQMSDVPSPITCNHVICVVDNPEGGYYYLDATGSEISYLYPPQSIQGKEVLVHYGEGEYKLVKVDPVTAKINAYTSTINIKFTDSDSIYGSGTDVYNGYQREKRTYRLKNYEKEDLDDYMKAICLNGTSKYTLKDYSMENLYENNNFLKINYNFSFQNTLIKDGEDYLFNPDLFDLGGIYYTTEDYSQTRKKNYHKENVFIYNIEIPDDFNIKYIPEKIIYEHDLIRFSATFIQEGNTIVVTKKYGYDLLEVPPSLFIEWNEFSKAMNRAAMQNIILTKKK